MTRSTRIISAGSVALSMLAVLAPDAQARFLVSGVHSAPPVTATPQSGSGFDWAAAALAAVIVGLVLALIAASVTARSGRRGSLAS
jgi:hypothetical protein